MELRLMRMEDRTFVMSLDRHVSAGRYEARVRNRSGYVLWEGDTPVGIMHYTLIWDSLPFLNLLYLPEELRGRRYGTQAMKLWEEEMKRQGYRMVLVSTQVDETAQHFYRKLGYVDCGALLLDHTPFEQPMEMFMRKVL